MDDDRAEAMVLSREGKFRGVVRLQKLVDGRADAPLDAMIVVGATQFGDDTTVWQSMEMLRGFLGEAVPLIGGDGRLIGVVPEEAVIRAYLEIVHDLREEENEAA